MDARWLLPWESKKTEKQRVRANGCEGTMLAQERGVVLKGYLPHPPSPQHPPSTIGRWQQHFSRNTSTDWGGGWHSSSFYFWAALLKSSVKLVPFSLIQPQVPVSVYGYKNKARRTKQKGGQTTTAAGLRRWRQAIENLCLLRCVGKLRARLRNPEEVHTLPVLPSQWEHYFPILKTKQMD